MPRHAGIMHFMAGTTPLLTPLRNIQPSFVFIAFKKMRVSPMWTENKETPVHTSAWARHAFF